MKLVNAVVGTKVQVKKCSNYTEFVGYQGTVIGTYTGDNVLVDFGVKRIGGYTLHNGYTNLKTGTKPDTDTCWFLKHNDLKIVKE